MSTVCSGRSRPSGKGEGGGGHPDPEIRVGGRGGLKKELFSAFRASVRSKNKGAPGPLGPLGPLSWIRH